MSAIKYSIVAGSIGFMSGLLWQEKLRWKPSNIFAATMIPPSAPMDVPMDVDENGNHVAQTMQFGFPTFDSVRSRKSYILSYDRRNRIPYWVFEHLTADHIKWNEQVDRSKSEFFEDSSIHPYFRSLNSDYKRSGFDRGHMAAAGNHRSSQELLDDTFVLSNMAPQVGKGFNRDAWNNLEKYVRGRVKQYKNLYVCTGPLYLPRLESDGKKYVKYQVIGNNNVAVPTHFFKVIVGETDSKEYDMEVYVMPNAPIEENIPLKAFQVPRDTVERATGFLLFEKLPSTIFRSINGKAPIAPKLKSSL